jgi:hypothetical protein
LSGGFKQLYYSITQYSEEYIRGGDWVGMEGLAGGKLDGMGLPESGRIGRMVGSGRIMGVICRILPGGVNFFSEYFSDNKEGV